MTPAGNGVVQSPNFPADYGSEYKNCQVSIVVPAGKRIRLEFTTFNLETDISSILVSNASIQIDCVSLNLNTIYTVLRVSI